MLEDVRRITPQAVIDTAIDNALQSLPKCAPARVVKWDSSTGRADCQILVKRIYRDEEGARQVVSYPVVTGVPVQFMGAGEMRLTFPVADGTGGSTATTGLLVFSHLSLDKWLTGDGAEVDPELDHQHALTDAVFIPGLRPFGDPYSSMPTDRATFGSDSDGNLRIEITDSDVQLGSGASKGVAREDDSVDIGTLAGVAATGGAVTFTFTPAGGSPQSGLTVTLAGSIAEGSVHIKAVD